MKPTTSSERWHASPSKPTSTSSSSRATRISSNSCGPASGFSIRGAADRRVSRSNGAVSRTGGPASVEEQWVGVENGSERLGVPPALVTDYLALVGDSSDNVPGVKGIGDKTAQELVSSYGSVENILAHAAELTKKRPREALLEQGDLALLSKELVTIREDLPLT